MARPPLDETFMAVARSFAKRSTCPRGAVGAALVKDRRVVATGYNGAPPGAPHCEDVGCKPADGCERTIHAEANAIAWAARHGVQTDGCVLYTTLSPCVVCARLLATAGIKEVVFAETYRLRQGLEELAGLGIPQRRWAPWL